MMIEYKDGKWIVQFEDRVFVLEDEMGEECVDITLGKDEMGKPFVLINGKKAEEAE